MQKTYGVTVEVGVEVPENWEIEKSYLDRAIGWELPDGSTIKPRVIFEIEKSDGTCYDLNGKEGEILGLSYDYRDLDIADEAEGA